MPIVDKVPPACDLLATWTEIAAALRSEVSVDTYARWFRDVEMTALDEKELTLRVPNNIYQLWIETNYLPLLRSAIMLAIGEPRTVRFTFGAENPAPVAVEAGEPAEVAIPGANAAETLPDDEPTPQANGMNAAQHVRVVRGRPE